MYFIRVKSFPSFGHHAIFINLLFKKSTAIIIVSFRLWFKFLKISHVIIITFYYVIPCSFSFSLSCSYHYIILYVWKSIICRFLFKFKGFHLSFFFLRSMSLIILCVGTYTFDEIIIFWRPYF